MRSAKLVRADTDECFFISSEAENGACGSGATVEWTQP
ncbi:MAG: hypothetical protein AVDCRST_MAG42-194 [uncultured Chthoniobacterales bacterium]|uniref:Uncharacterized protein n=1 Tax=uncultured Chthoniobacterales bacterium TaxID=1836801 RepID=A0A6J4H6K3_9BACT|nr:MAG: hypothetical protein AVDCRST_MAG42-194 [uncultured Chthoniobacterales bacterium]